MYSQLYKYDQLLRNVVHQCKMKHEYTRLRVVEINRYLHRSSVIRGITFAGPGRNELPTFIQVSQLSKLRMSKFERTEGKNSSEAIGDQLCITAGIYIHDITQAGITSLEINND